MKNIFRKKKYPYAFLYVCATFISLVIVFAYLYINEEGTLSQWLYGNKWNTGSDFFDCIPAVKGYGIGFGIVEQYPPLAKLFFLLIAHIFLHDNIPLDAVIKGSITDLRMCQAALMPFIIFILFIAIVIVMLVSGFFKEEKQWGIIGISVISTYSFIYAIERGNIVCLSFMFLMYYIVYYQSDDKVLKETALISLALSAGLKLYPAAFGVLLLYERRWKEAGRTIIYGILSLLIPYIITKNHLPESEFSGFVSGVAKWGEGLIEGVVGVASTQQQIFFGISIIIGLIGAVIIAIKGEKHWISVFYAGVLAIVCGVQFRYPYAYVCLIPSLISFLKEEKQMNIKNGIYFILLCILNLPLPIFGSAKYFTASLVGDVEMWSLFIMMILVTVLEFPMGKDKERGFL